MPQFTRPLNEANGLEEANSTIIYMHDEELHTRLLDAHSGDEHDDAVTSLECGTYSEKTNQSSLNETSLKKLPAQKYESQQYQPSTSVRPQLGEQRNEGGEVSARRDSDETEPLIRKSNTSRSRTLSATLSAAAVMALSGFRSTPTSSAEQPSHEVYHISDEEKQAEHHSPLPLVDQHHFSTTQPHSSGPSMVLGTEAPFIADTLTRPDGSGYCRRGGAHYWRPAYPKHCWALGELTNVNHALVAHTL
jgi:hypothetical protein